MENLKLDVNANGTTVSITRPDTDQKTFIVLEKVVSMELLKVAGFYTTTIYMVGDTDYVFTIKTDEHNAKEDSYELYDTLKGLIDKCLMT
jgi:hypothetical protein